jgi:hypothetical protein
MPNQITTIAPYWLEEVGTWVFDEPMAGLCPALFRSFDRAPAELYVKAEAKGE